MEEIWKDIEGYEGIYQVSNLGRVKKIGRCKKPKLMSLNRFNDKGYIRVNFGINGHQKHFVVHRLVAKAFISNPNNLPQVNHKDGNKHNNCVDNLEWVTNDENYKHAVKMGLFNHEPKPVALFENNVEIARFESIIQAKRETKGKYGDPTYYIYEKPKGKKKKNKGYKWVVL